MLLARSAISRGMVAEKNSVWRLAGSFVDDLADVVDEAHVEHAVGFVEHEDLDAVEVQGALLHEVEQASGRRNQHVDAAREGADLAAERDPADGECHARSQIAPVGLEALDDLRGELAGRAQHQHAAGARFGPARVLGEMIEDRQREGRGLAGSGLCDADDIACCEHLRDGLRLDRRRGGILLVFECAGDGFGEAELEKRGQCRIFHVAKPAGLQKGAVAGSRGEAGHPAWSGLSMSSEMKRRVENQDVEFVHATRGWLLLDEVEWPSISTSRHVAT